LYRPQLELLEGRWQPGSTLTNLGWAMLGGALAFLEPDSSVGLSAVSEPPAERYVPALLTLSDGTTANQAASPVETDPVQETAAATRPEQTIQNKQPADVTLPLQDQGQGQQITPVIPSEALAGSAHTVSSTTTPTAAPGGVGAVPVVPVANHSSGGSANGIVPTPLARPGHVAPGTPGRVTPVAVGNGNQRAPALGLINLGHSNGSRLGVVYSTFFGGPGTDYGTSIDATDDGTSFTTGTYFDPVFSQQDAFVVSITGGGATNAVLILATNGDTLVGTGISVVDAPEPQNAIYVVANDLGPMTPGAYVIMLDQTLGLQNFAFLPNVTLNGIDLGEGDGNVYVTGWVFNPDGSSDTFVACYTPDLATSTTITIPRFDPATGSHLNSCGFGIEADLVGNVYIASTIDDAPGDSIGALSQVAAGLVAENWVDMFPNGLGPGRGGAFAAESRDDDPQGLVYVGGSYSNPASPGPYKTDGLIAQVQAATGVVNWSDEYSYGVNGDYALNGLEVDPAGNPYATGPAWYNGFGYFPHISKFDPSGTSITNYYTFPGSNPALQSYGNGIEVQDSSGGNGDVYVTGYTADPTFMPNTGTYQTAYGGGPSDAFITRGTQPI
jgi:hypothetical protein